jgi:hypothetical protein
VCLNQTLPLTCCQAHKEIAQASLHAGMQVQLWLFD